MKGIVSCIERVKEKIVDIIIKTKKCKSCMFWERKKDTPSYLDWKESHECNVNHTGSASSMETSGTFDIFHRSIEK